MPANGAMLVTVRGRIIASVVIVIALVAVSHDVLAFQRAAPPKTETYGPFALGPAPGHRVTVIASYAPAAKPFDDDLTVTTWSILDATGTTLFRQVIDPEKHPEQFATVTIISS